jgi:hypothetical protein
VTVRDTGADAEGVVDLIRIKTLSNADVALARIEELPNAEPEQFCEAIAQTDEELTVSGASAFSRFASLLRCSQELARWLLEAGADRTSKPQKPE